MSKCVKVYFKDGRILVINGVTDSDSHGDIVTVDTSDTHCLINMKEVLYTVSTMEPDDKMPDGVMTMIH